MRATSPSGARSSRAPWTSRSAARRGSGGRRTIWVARSTQRWGKTSSTSGRARASTRSGRSARLRSAASTKVTVGRSPHWRSSRTRITGPSAHAARTSSSAARRIWSPIRTGSARAARSWGLSSSGNGAPTSSPRKTAVRAASGAEAAALARRRIFSRRTSGGSLSPMPAPLRTARASMAKAEPALRGSPAPIQVWKRAPRSRRRRRSSWRTRDLPAPASPVRSAALAAESSAQWEKSASRRPSSRSRPTQRVGRPRSRRAASSASTSAWRTRVAPSGRTSKRSPRSPAVTSSTRTGDDAPAAARSCTARSIMSPTGRRASISTSPAERETAAPPSASRTASAQRAARTARIRGRARAAEHHHQRPVGELLEPPLVALDRGEQGGREPAPARHRRLGSVAHHHQGREAPLVGGDLAGGAPGRRHAVAGVVGADLDGLERVRHGVGVGRAGGALLGEEAGDELVERAGYARAKGGDARRLLEHDLEHAGQRAVAGEGVPPAQAAEEHRPQREQIRAGVDAAIAAHLLRRHVAGGAQHHAGGRELGPGIRDPRDAEVDEHRPLGRPLHEEDVAGLGVAVDDAGAVDGAEGAGDGEAERHALGDLQRRAGEAPGERLAHQPVHGEVGLALLRQPLGEVTDDARVVELREHPRLPGEAARALRAPVVEDLERGAAPGVPINGLVDAAHAALTRDPHDVEPAADAL